MDAAVGVDSEGNELESSKEAQEVHGGGCEAAEKEALGTVDAGEEALEAAMEQVLDAADAGQDAGTEKETPCKGKGPHGVQLDTPEKPAAEVKRKRGRPRKETP